jgi:Zn-finger nucleic acid-binding protein
MIVLELDEVEIDYCISCHGIWLDAGELELLLENSAGRDDFLSSLKTETGTSERPVKCPICDRKMEKVLCGTPGVVRIDRCERGDGVWLDEGELEAILTLADSGREDRILSLLKDMFGKKAG